jgi:hypothetical protein
VGTAAKAAAGVTTTPAAASTAARSGRALGTRSPLALTRDARHDDDLWCNCWWWRSGVVSRSGSRSGSAEFRSDDKNKLVDDDRNFGPVAFVTSLVLRLLLRRRRLPCWDNSSLVHWW